MLSAMVNVSSGCVVLAGEAIADYQVIEAGDTVLFGGKDSDAMLDLLYSLHQAVPIAFHLIAVNPEQK